MSSIFNPPKFKAQVQQPVESITELDPDRKKIRKPTGRSNSLLAGLQNALKSKLGE